MIELILSYWPLLLCGVAALLIGFICLLVFLYGCVQEVTQTIRLIVESFEAARRNAKEQESAAKGEEDAK